MLRRRNKRTLLRNRDQQKSHVTSEIEDGIQSLINNKNDVDSTKITATTRLGIASVLPVLFRLKMILSSALINSAFAVKQRVREKIMFCSRI